MARRKKKLTHCEAKAMLHKQGVDFSKDVFEQRMSDMQLVVDAAHAAGYRKPPNAPGSTGRMYYELLQRQRRCR
jgi:hypothetical protein